MEDTLRDYGIDRASYHGGALTGNPVSRFCLKSDEIFDAFQDQLLDYVADPTHTCLADEQEVRVMISRFKELVVLLDGFFALHMMSHEEYLKDEDGSKELAAKYVLAVQKRWRQIGLSVLGPKYHSLSHFVKMFVDL